MKTISLYDQEVSLETLNEWKTELNEIKTDKGEREYIITLSSLICWNLKIFLFEEEYQQLALKWIFDKQNYKKTIPIIIYHSLPFKERNSVREFYMHRSMKGDCDVDWDILESGKELEKWILEEAPSDLYYLWNESWKKDYEKLGLKDSVGVYLDIDVYDSTIRQLLLIKDAL